MISLAMSDRPHRQAPLSVLSIEESAIGFHHPVDELADRLRAGAACDASGLTGGYAAATLAQLSQRIDEILVVVTPDLVQARNLATDLQAFGAGRIRETIQVIPSPDVSPYGEVSPDRQLVLDRLNAQFRLAMGDELRFVLVPAVGLMRKVAPWQAIESASTILSIGDSVDLDELRQTLHRGGYAAVRLVEDPGTFAIRGGLIDVFTPYSSHPVRLDLWGDEIESIRAFDPQTQRTTEDRSEVFILPAREEILSEDAFARARVRLRRLGDELQMPSSRVSELLDNLEGGVSFFGVEALLPGLYELVSVLESLPDNVVWITLNPDAVEERVEERWKALATEYETHISEGEIGFPPEDFFYPPEAALRQVRCAKPRLDLVPVVTRGDTFEFRAHDNADVERLRKSHQETEGAVHALLGPLQDWRSRYGRVAFCCSTSGLSDRIARLLRAYGQKVSLRGTTIPLEVVPPPSDTIEVYTATLTSGFRSPALSTALIPDSLLFGRSARRPATKVVADAFAISHFRELSAGDLVVHVDFGLARYNGMEKLVLDGVARDFLRLEFAGADKLYLPVYRLGRVHKHVGGDSANLALDKLGGVKWGRTKARVKEDLRELAVELLQLYAERANRNGLSFPPPDEYFREFEAAFPFEETPHQDAAIQEVISDLVSKKPMDRLLCGDVGFGKTEVAIRAAFLAVLFGKQVAVLVPTTILAEQHARTFQERLRQYPVTVETLSRFRNKVEQKDILARAEKGAVDILIGTHRLLSDDVCFRDLGLLVVDEEQRFGVRHKEKVKQLKKSVDVLTMTATPIPRTLEMSLMGIRDLSVILTPPTNRKAVRTSVAQFGHGVIREGIERELKRGGQIYFVNNRVRGIEELAKTIREIVPEARVAVGHAQMSNTALEKVMLSFVNHEIDVLVCTTIIESGLDISSANTIFINRADALGLAQLYQLRGRVGRSRERAHCYLLIPRRRRLRDDAARRLEVIRTHTELGSGLYIAQHDLDIRGAGDLLGKDQSGNIRTIGYDLFCELLDETIREQRGEDVTAQVEPEVNIPVSAYLPDDYIPDEGLRLLFYKRLSLARSDEELDEVMTELVDRFGRFPPEVATLREIISIKTALAELGIETVETGVSAVVFSFSESCRLSPDKVVELVEREQGRFVLRQDMKLIRYLRGKESEDLIAATRLAVERVRTCWTE